jgi:lysozyme
MEYEKLKEEIKEHEGYRAMVYNDILGKRTIGYGHLCRDDEKWEDGKNYDHRHLEKIFEYDFSVAYRGAMSLHDNFDELPKPVQEVFIEACFVIGTTGFSKFKKTLELIKNKQYTEASEEIKNSLWYRQVPQRVEMLSQKLQNV